MDLRMGTEDIDMRIDMGMRMDIDMYMDDYHVCTYCTSSSRIFAKIRKLVIPQVQYSTLQSLSKSSALVLKPFF